MRVLALTDIHASYDRMKDILGKETGYDVVVIGGDLTTYGTPAEAEAAIQEAQSFGKPVLAITGNMDPIIIESSLERLGVSINGRGVVVDGVGFFGVSAAPISPLHTPHEIPEDEIMKRAESGWADVQHATVRIFVPHAPPFNTTVDRIHLGKHVGSTAVREFIERRQPDIAVCGHIHEARGQDTIGGTKVVNCGPAGRGCYAWIEVGEGISVENRG